MSSITSNLRSPTTSKLLLFSNLTLASSEINRSTLVGSMGLGLFLLFLLEGGCLVVLVFLVDCLVGFLGAMVGI